MHFSTTDLELSVAQIIEYYGTRWKIEAGFKELKQDVGNCTSQCRHAQTLQTVEKFSGGGVITHGGLMRLLFGL